MSKKVTAMEARQNFGQFLDQVYLTQEDIIIERAGKPLARLTKVSSNNSSKLDFRDISKLPNDIWETC